MGRHKALSGLGRLLLLAGLILLIGMPLAPLRAGIGYPAPNWSVKTWINSEPLDLPRLRGRIVVLEFFQMDCRLCEEFTLPVLKDWYLKFSAEIEARELVFVSIHSVPELALYQTEPRLRRFVSARGIRRAVGIDKSSYGHELPVTMRRYKVTGLPVMVFIDKRGDIRYRRDGRFSAHEAEKVLRRLLAE
ncbi:MAG: hypothetical protein C0605_15535 [Hyphomicrobiales bacterium]|nr:MAG: hypothetical protein C0605_15535 [Hyphomicrobiales bacterium]